MYIETLLVDEELADQVWGVGFRIDLRNELLIRHPRATERLVGMTSGQGVGQATFEGR